ncbi:MAG: hypothetical protein ACYC2R_09705 [Burkholderiales bacterium]
MSEIANSMPHSMNTMRSTISLNQYARGHLVGARATATPLREEVEIAAAHDSAA